MQHQSAGEQPSMSDAIHIPPIAPRRPTIPTGSQFSSMLRVVNASYNYMEHRHQLETNHKQHIISQLQDLQTDAISITEDLSAVRSQLCKYQTQFTESMQNLQQLIQVAHSSKESNNRLSSKLDDIEHVILNTSQKFTTLNANLQTNALQLVDLQNKQLNEIQKIGKESALKLETITMQQQQQQQIDRVESNRPQHKPHAQQQQQSTGPPWSSGGNQVRFNRAGTGAYSTNGPKQGKQGQLGKDESAGFQTQFGTKAAATAHTSSSGTDVDYSWLNDMFDDAPPAPASTATPQYDSQTFDSNHWGQQYTSSSRDMPTPSETGPIPTRRAQPSSHHNSHPQQRPNPIHKPFGFRDEPTSIFRGQENIQPNAAGAGGGVKQPKHPSQGFHQEQPDQASFTSYANGSSTGRPGGAANKQPQPPAHSTRNETGQTFPHHQFAPGAESTYKGDHQSGLRARGPATAHRPVANENGSSRFTASNLSKPTNDEMVNNLSTFFREFK